MAHAPAGTSRRRLCSGWGMLRTVSRKPLSAHRLGQAAKAGKQGPGDSPPEQQAPPRRPKEGAPEPAQADGGGFSWGQAAADVAVNPLTYLVAIALSVLVVNSVGDSDSLIFILAALPVVGLTALSKSSAGQQIADKVEAELPELEAVASAKRAEWAAAERRSPHFGADRLRLPGPPGAAPHLDGSMAGDQGFDPLGLWAAADEGRRAWYREAELLHARWAMLAVVGCLLPEALALGGVEGLGEPVWWKVGAAKLNSEMSLNYAGIEGFRIAGNKGIWLIAACQVPLMAGPEYARYVGIRSLLPVGVFLPGQQEYPGGVPFDPLRLSDDPDGFLDQSVKEIKNGRLAMIAMLGFFVQAAVTRQGPVANALAAL